MQHKTKNKPKEARNSEEADKAGRRNFKIINSFSEIRYYILTITRCLEKEKPWGVGRGRILTS